MPRLLLVVASLLLVGFVGGSATATDGDPNGDRKDGTRITLYAVETASTTVSATGTVNPPEEDPAGFTAGARIILVETLYRDEDRTREVGRNDILCTVTEVAGTPEEPTGATIACDGTVSLDNRGTLTWAGAATFEFAETGPGDEPFATVAITGGTEAFRAAGGQIEIFEEGVEDEEAPLSRYEVQLLKFETDD